MAKRSGNDMSKLTRRTSKNAKTQDSKEAERHKLTLYLDHDELRGVKRMEFEIKDELQTTSRAYSRNNIIEEAVKMALEAYKADGIKSEIVKRIIEKDPKQPDN